MKTVRENIPEKSLSQKRHPILQKLLSVLLCACLLLASLPMEGYGSKVQAEEPQKKVLSFSELPEEVKYQTVEPGTPLEELNLPETLEGMCVPVEQNGNANPETLVQPEVKGTAPEGGSLPEEQEVSENTDGEALPEETQDVSGNENSEAELPAEHETEESEPPAENGPEEQPESLAPDTEPGTGEVPEGNPEEGPETDTDSNSNSNAEETVVIEHVTWTGTPAYDSETEGVYVFVPVLPEGYVMAEGVALPEIRVTVGKAGVPATSDSPEGESTGENQAGKESEDGTTEKGERLKESRTKALAEGEEPVAVTPSCGVISEDTTWTGGTLSDGTVTVNEGITLTVTGMVEITGNIVVEGGGTIMSNSPYLSGNRGIFVLNGTSSGLTIRNTTLDGDGNSANAIVTCEGSTVILDDGCILQNCGAGVSGSQNNRKGTLIVKEAVIQNCKWGITASRDTEINGAVIRDCDYGISMDGSNVKISRTTIENCHDIAIEISDFHSYSYSYSYSTLDIQETTIRNCSGENGAAILCRGYYKEFIPFDFDNLRTVINLRETVIEGCRGIYRGAIDLAHGILNIYSGTYCNNATAVEREQDADETEQTGGGFASFRSATVNIYGGEFLENKSDTRGGCFKNDTVSSINIYGGLSEGIPAVLSMIRRITEAAAQSAIWGWIMELPVNWYCPVM